MLTLSGIALLLVSQATSADTPLGWINSSNNSAYTTTRGDLEISLAGLAVNDTLDVFSFRDDLLANNSRLVGDSGDLSGEKLELHYGVLEEFSVFYKRQQHSLTVDLGPIASINLIDIDTSLDTKMESAGFKWTFYEANLLNPNNRRTAASLEVAAFKNSSDDFAALLDEVRYSNFTIYFLNPQTFAVSDLEDEGWTARVITSWALQDYAVASIWAGYGQSKSTSALTTDVLNATIRRLFEQSFNSEETYLLLGASLNTQITPRLSVVASYEFVSIRDSSFERFPQTPPVGLPGFLNSASESGASRNHTFSARLGYWLTPRLNLSLTGSLYSNQFVGELPHYNNALSGAFSEIPYGYAGLELNYRISRTQ